MQQKHFMTPHASEVISRASRIIFAAAGPIALAGCGAWQATKDSTVDAAKWVFTTQVKTMNIDLNARAATNETSGGQSLSTVVRLYQLKDAQTFSKLEYVQLQNNDLELLKADLLATKDVVLRPGASASVSEPMDKAAEYVGVVAFFRAPDSKGVWKLLIPKKQWKDTDPVSVQVQTNLLSYEGAHPKPVRHEAPQQSKPAPSASPGMTASSVAGTAANDVMTGATNNAAALGNAADSAGYSSTPTRIAAQNVNGAADSISGARASANAASRSAAGLSR
jgi:type VI secretion system protein VasD